MKKIAGILVFLRTESERRKGSFWFWVDDSTCLYWRSSDKTRHLIGKFLPGDTSHLVVMDPEEWLP